MTLEAYHRSPHPENPNEFNQVRQSNSVRGYEAKVLAWGLCVQAYPYLANGKPDAYSFGTDVPAKVSYGFRDRKPIIREVRWDLEIEGVNEDRDDQGREFAYILTTWVER